RDLRSMVRQASDFFTQFPDSLSMSGRIAHDGFAPAVTESLTRRTSCFAPNHVRRMSLTSSMHTAPVVCECGAASARGAKAARQSAGMAARVSDTLPSSHPALTWCWSSGASVQGRQTIAWGNFVELLHAMVGSMVDQYTTIGLIVEPDSLS